jgi:Fe-S cluster assembly protein SufD
MNRNAAQPLQHYTDSLTRLQPQLAGTGQPWLEAQRREAAARLAELGFPQRRQEAWRYTSVARLLEHDFVPAPATGAVPPVDTGLFLLPSAQAYRLVFVNGHLAPAQSRLAGLPDGVTIGGLGQHIAQESIVPARWLGRAAGTPAHAFSALNSATIQDGLLVVIPRGVELTRPIEVLHLSTTAGDDRLMSQPRSLVLLEAGARATLIERFAGRASAPCFHNGLSEIFLQEDAALEHLRLQDESPAAFHLHSVFVNQHARSRYRNSSYALGGAWSRTELAIDFRGAAASAELDGLYVAGKQQLSDVHLDIRHAVPGCASQSRYHGVLHGAGRAVFDGRIVVSPDAQQSDAHLHNANLLLSRSAEVDTKPQLEIYADDVRCSHGATVGQLDPAQLFYLRSRGIDAGEAGRMLCLGFASEILQRCRLAPLRDTVEAALAARLAEEPAAGGAEQTA